MAKDVDFRYNEIYAELDMYLHCVENLITQYENSSDEKRKLISHTQVSKFKPLIKLVRSSNKRMSLENLNKCKNVFMKLYNKVNKSDNESGGSIAPDNSRDFETVRAKLNLIVSQSRKQKDNYCKESNETTSQTQSLFPLVTSIVTNESNNTALNAYMNSHIVLNQEYTSKKTDEPRSTITNEKKDAQQSLRSLYYRREYKLTESTSKERQSFNLKNTESQKNDSHSNNTEKKSQFKTQDKEYKKPDKIHETKVSINEETDIDILEEIRSDLVKKLECEATCSKSLKLNEDIEKLQNKFDKSTIDTKIQKSLLNCNTKDLDSTDKISKLYSTGIAGNNSVFNVIPVNMLDKKTNKDNIIDEEIEKALNKEISGLELSLIPSYSAIKKEVLPNSSTKILEKSTSRRISLDTYKEKHSTTTDQKPLDEGNVMISSKQLFSSCPASPDPEDCQNSISITTATPIPIEDNFKPLDSIQLASLQWPNTIQKTVEQKREWKSSQIDYNKQNFMNTNYSPVVPQNYMNLIGSPLYRTNMANNAPKCNDIDMRQFPRQPSPLVSGFSPSNRMDNSLTGVASTSNVGSSNFKSFNTIENIDSMKNIGNISKNIYKPLTREPIVTIVNQDSEIVDCDFRIFDNSHQFQRDRSTHHNDFVRGKSQNRDQYFRGRSMERNEKEKSIGKNDREKSIGRNEREKSIGRNHRENSIGNNMNEQNIGHNYRGRSMSRNISEFSMRRNEREKSIGRNISEFNMGRNEREKSMGRNISEFNMRRNEREKSVGRNINEYNIGRNEREKSIGRNIGEVNIRRNEREKSIGRNISEFNIGRNERDKSVGRNINEYNMGRNEREKSIGRNIGEVNIRRNEREKSIGRNISEFNMGRNEREKSEFSMGRYDREKSFGRNIRERSMGRNTRECSIGKYNRKYSSGPYGRDFNRFNRDENTGKYDRNNRFGQFNRGRSVGRHDKEPIGTFTKGSNNEQNIGLNKQFSKMNRNDKFHWKNNSNRNFSSYGNAQVNNQKTINDTFSKNIPTEQNIQKVSTTEISQKTKNNISTVDDSKKSILNYKIPRIKKPDNDMHGNAPCSQSEPKMLNNESLPANSDIIDEENSFSNDINVFESIKEDDSIVVSASNINSDDENETVVQSSQKTYSSSLNHSIEEADSTNKLNECDTDIIKPYDEPHTIAQTSNEAPNTTSNKDGDKEIFDDKTFYTLMETLRQKKNAIPEKYIQIIEMYNDLRSKEEQSLVEENVSESTINKESVSESAINKENVSESTVNKENVSESTINKESVSESTINKENVSESTINKKNISESTKNDGNVSDCANNKKNVSESTKTDNIFSECAKIEENEPAAAINKDKQVEKIMEDNEKITLITEKKLEKGNRELRMLQQDVRDMFISRGVLEANGKRVVKSISESKEPEKIERPRRAAKNNIDDIVEENSPNKHDNDSSDFSIDSSPINIKRRSLRNKPMIEETEIPKKVSPLKKALSFSTKEKVKKNQKKIKKKKLKKHKNKVLVPLAEKIILKEIPDLQIDNSKNCLQCKTSKIRDVVYHFKTRHPKEDIPTSKLNDKVAKDAIQLVKSGIFDTFCTPSSQKCAFCEKLFDIEFPKSLLHHIAYCHTGEYDINCNSCVHLSNGRCTYDCIENKLLGKPHAAKKIPDVKGYICDLCNYVQISQDNLKSHNLEAHPNQECKIFEISLTLNTDDSILKKLDTHELSANNTIETESSKKIDDKEPENMQLDTINPCLDGIFSSSRNINSPNFDSTYVDTINNIKQECDDMILDYDQHEMEELAKSLELLESNNYYFDSLSKNIVKVSDIKIEICQVTENFKYSCPVENCGYFNTILSEYEDHLASYDEGSNFIWDGYCDICNTETYKEYSMEKLPILNAFKHALSYHMPIQTKKQTQLDLIRTDSNKEPTSDLSPIRIANVFSLAQNIQTIASEPSTSEEISIVSPEMEICSFCNLTYPDEDILLKHVVHEHIKAGTYEHFFKCAVDSCKFECHQSHIFSDHFTTNHPNCTSWKCIYCDIVIPKHNKLLIVHMQKDHCREAFKCKMCDFRSNEVKKMINHLENTHRSKFKYSFLRIPYNALPENISNTTDDLYICSKCGFSSDSEITFLQHFSDVNCLTCGDCKNRNFKSNNAVVSHYKKVHIWRNISCNYCNFRSISLKAIKRHGNNTHNVKNSVLWRIIPRSPLLCENNKHFSCCSCYFVSNHPSELLEHLKLHDKHDLNVFNCKHCKTEFDNGERLVEHIYITHFPWANLSKMYDFDTSDQPREDKNPPVQAYTCIESGQKFITKESFVKHCLNCSVKHICQICHSEPYNVESLITHLSVHHNFGVYYCTQCDYVNDDCNLINDHFKTFHKFKTPLIFMRYNSQDSPTGVLLLLNLNTIIGKRHLLHQVVTDFRRIVNYQPQQDYSINLNRELLDDNMAISTESNVTDTFQQGNNDQSELENNAIAESSSNYLMEREEQEQNSDTDDDVLYIDDGTVDKIKNTNNDNLDFKTTVLKRDSIDFNTAKESVPKSSTQMSNKLPITNLKGNELFRCAGSGCDYSCSSSKKFQNHTYACTFVKDNLLCFHCGELFYKVSMLLHHIMTHSKAKYTCDVCKITMSSPKLISMHVKKSHGVTDLSIVPLDDKKTNQDEDSFIVKSRDTAVLEINPVVLQLSFDPTEIQSIPNRPIFPNFVKCKICSYENKVRTNIIRHLQMHLNDDDSSIPTAAPVNPVPHLETNELYFDKMTNLALSSNIDKLQEKTPTKTASNIFKSSVSSANIEDKYPKFVIENKRFVCGSLACVYTSISEEMLRRHWESLHSDEEAFRCQHCDLYLTKQENSSMISVISQHFHLHKEKLYKCSTCDFLADEIHYVKNHSFKAHNHKIFITIRDNIVDTNQVMNWRCAFCNVKTALKKEIMEHVQSIHSFKDQYKCNICGIFRPTYNTAVSHFKKLHNHLPLDVTPSFHHMNDTQETMPEKRKRTSSNTSTPEKKNRTSSNTSTSEKRKRTLSNTKTDLEKPKKPKISNESTIESIYIDPDWTFGQPENGNYKCSICNIFSSPDVEEFESHLRHELKYQRYGCTFCDYKSDLENAVINHSLDEHAMCEVKLLSKNTKAEQWINDYLIYQKSRLTIKSKKESPDSSSMSSLRENDEDDFMDLEDAKSNSETKVEDAYDFVDDSTSDKIKKCPYCDGFVGKNLRVHIMRHKGIKPYKCHYCDYDAVTMIEVRLHQRRSHKTLPINVVSKNDENSNKEIDIPKQLKYARKNIKQYVCTVCKTHVTRLNIADHKSICHPNSTTELILLKNSDVLVCSICNAYAVNEPLMNDHFKASHPGAAIIYKNEKLGKKGTKLFRRFSCKYCLTNYIEYSELLDHFQKNHKEIPIQIVAYTTSNARTTGETTIKEDLKCIITGCDSTLKTPLDLLFHVRCHYESYYCEPCSLLFNSHSKYSNHPCPKGAVIPKNKIGGAILNQRLPQIYQILSQIYGADLKSVTCEDYLSNVDRPDVTDVIEIRKPGEPLPKKLKQVAKKSTTQVNPQHLKFI